MARLVDLTGTICNRMWRYPPPFRDPEIRYLEAGWAPGMKFYFEELHMNTLVGTYFETPAHFFKKSFTVDEWPVEEMIREALLIKVPKKAHEAITVEEVKAWLLRERQEIMAGETVLLATGWDRYWRSKERFVQDSPYFDKHLIKWLLERGVSLLGSDIPSFDNIQEPQGFMPQLMRKGVVIVAPLVNLMSVPAARIRLYLFPLKISGACASPCRVVCEY